MNVTTNKPKAPLNCWRNSKALNVVGAINATIVISAILSRLQHVGNKKLPGNYCLAGYTGREAL